MRLVLEVVSAQAALMGGGRRCVVGSEGIQIGREAGAASSWVLPDPSQYVSRHHATIRFVNGLFFIEGRGRSPIALNRRDRTLRNDDPHPLNDGDRIFIDEYEIRATIAPEGPPAVASAVPSTAVDPIAELVIPQGQPPPQTEGRSSGYTSIIPDASVDVLKLIEKPPPAAVSAKPVLPPAPVPSKSAIDSFLEQAMPPVGADIGPPGATSESEDDWFDINTQPFTPPAAVPGAQRPVDPPQYGSESAQQVASAKRLATPAPAVTPPASHAVPRPSPSVRPPRTISPSQSVAGSAGPSALRALLKGAGLDTGGQTLSPEVEQQLGEALRIVVQGTIDVLRARTSIKSQFRMPLTQLARQDNNPLKFSVDAADALHNLLLKPGGAFLSAPMAFEDAFDDIRFHQLAVWKGIEAGFERLLAQFDPDALQQRFDKAAAGTGALGKIASGAKARRWDQYVEMHRELAADRDDAFRRLFGDAFAAAYENELTRLKNVSREARRPGAPS